MLQKQDAIIYNNYTKYNQIAFYNNNHQIYKSGKKIVKEYLNKIQKF